MTANPPTKLKAALIGGGALGVASQIPILNLANCACCALVIGGGILASYLYLKDSPPTAQAPYGDGLLLGLLTGVIGAFVGSIMSIPMTLLTSRLGTMDFLQEALQNSDVPPEVQDMLANFGSSGFAVGALLIGLLISVPIYCIFASIGSLIGVAIFNKKALETAGS